jgi:UTP--glucose-1-phosphate uridylyltransferase
MTQKIRSLVIPAAGQGTRLLPVTKVTPKELLAVYDRPALQFAMDEAVALGVERVVVVTHPDKGKIRQYLAAHHAHVQLLNRAGKPHLGAAMADIQMPDDLEIVFVEQDEALGLGHAVLCAETAVLPGPFGVILPDDLILGQPCLPEMAAHYSQGHMIAAMEVTPEETRSYGIFRLAGPSIGRSLSVLGMVEKPAPDLAPSRLAAVGRYILDPGIFASLHRGEKGAGDEIQLTDAIARDAQTTPITAYRFSGTRYDCGTHDGLLMAGLARQRAVKDAAGQAGLTEAASPPPLKAQG